MSLVPIYNAILVVLCYGGAGYAVFFLNRSPWWFLAAVGLFVAAAMESKGERKP